nr:hypothetical protein [Bacillaceae bacterium]
MQTGIFFGRRKGPARGRICASGSARFAAGKGFGTGPVSPKGIARRPFFEKDRDRRFVPRTTGPLLAGP